MKKENTSPNFIEMEKDILKFWEDEKCFEKLVEQNKNNERFRFLDGPITANNAMGIHHAWGRSFKDMYIKFNSMLGKSCQFQNGFDAQGLWVEVEVEKELGIVAKSDIVKYGMGNFTNKCMSRVEKFSKIITEQSKRLGQWMDWDNSYYTNSDTNITSIWHFLRKCHDNGWLKKSHRPMPWCPRCGTSLSEHEMSGSYKELEHLSIFAKLKIKDTNDKIILWTTTPWTLSANVALAINPEIEYVRVKVKSDDCTLVIGKNAVGKLTKGDIIEIVDTFKGEELVGKEYETCFPDFNVQKFAHKIVAWEDVDASEGTGVVHIAPGCGAEDFELGKKLELPMICPIDEEGRLLDDYGFLAKKMSKEVVELVVAELEKQGKLYKTLLYKHSYPLCWRCKTEVVFKLVDEWYIDTSEIKPKLLEAVNTVKWEPEYAGKRMIDWLNNMGDWNISRKRFYGLPLPFYPCKKCGHLTVIGSKDELKEMSEAKDLSSVPHLHRPFIDEIKVICPKCGEAVTRVPEVGDCWLDAGITPFSTKKYFEDKDYFNKNFPSELVIEMKEQIRLWFYSLLFMSVTLEGKAPYENVVAYSSVVNEEGGKFSKTGFMIRFDEAAEKIGADTIRYLFASGNIANDVRFGYNLSDESRRKILSFWNVYVFFNLYASIDNPDIKNHKIDIDTLPHSDKWLIARTNKYTRLATEYMKTYKANQLIKEFEVFIDDVSNWYIRINRKRFWKSTDKNDQMNAYWCLYNAIKNSIGTLAPIMPFLSDYIWQNMVREIEKDEKLSIHLSAYPTELPLDIDEKIIDETNIAREIIATAQRMRNESQLKIKQPLSKMFIKAKDGESETVKDLISTIKDELNIKTVEYVNDESIFNDVYYTVNFRNAGAVLKGEAQKLKAIIDGMDADGHKNITEQLKTQKFSVTGFENLDAKLLDSHNRPKADYAVATENNRTIAIFTQLTKELLQEGAVRELIRIIQVFRKDTDLAVEQRIQIGIKTTDETLQKAINIHKEKIMQDILANEMTDTIPNPIATGEFKVGGVDVILTLKI